MRAKPEAWKALKPIALDQEITLQDAMTSAINDYLRAPDRALAPAKPKCPSFSISGSEFVEIFVGVGAPRLRDLFEQARAKAARRARPRTWRRRIYETTRSTMLRARKPKLTTMPQTKKTAI
jgi:hypothetical protein